MRSYYVTTCFLLLAVPVCGSADSSATSGTGNSISYGTRAKPLEQAAPRYPKRALQKGQEGWVELSYIVGTDGLVYDPIIEDSSGISAFEGRALQTVKGWRFEPATWKDKPIEQAHTKVRVMFAIDGQQRRRGAGQKFIRREKKFNQFLKEGDLEAAGEWLNASFEVAEWNLYETTRLWISSYYLYAAREDDMNQLKSLSRASSGRKFVRPATSAEILRTKFVVEARLGKLVDALETYELLLGEESAISDEDPLAEFAEDFRNFISSGKTIATDALVETEGEECCDAVWGHQLFRRKFVLDNIEGEIKELDIRCDWQRASEKEIYVGKVWEIPASWGTCSLYVHGNEGTTFRLLELSDQQN